MNHAPERIEPGTSVGPYVVERRLAQGGMSVLYLARDTEGERVVLKMVAPEVATSATRARLLREARALAAVDHPGVVRVHGTGEHEGMPWIVMDYVHGTDLKRVLADRGAFPVAVALRYAIQCAEALVAAHDAGVIHRDLKPSNLLLTPEGRIVLVDFGIAKRRAESRDEDVLTSAREVLGTPAYLSPEQLEHGLADERSDVWSLGCVLYEMVVGAPPFGRGGSATTAAILRDEPLFPPQLAGAIVHIVSACLRKSSFARIASPRELLFVLRDALDDPSSELATGYERSSPSSSMIRSSMRPSVRPSGAPGGSTPPPRTPSSSRLSSAPVSGRPSSGPPPSRSSSPSLRAARTPSSAFRVAVPRGRVKGTAVRAGLAWFAQTYGEEGLTRLGDLASPELRAMLRPADPALGLIASGWYDTQLIGELLGLAEHVAQPLDPAELGLRIAEAVARDNVGGVYRALFRLVASPKLLEANAQRVWRTYVDEGTLAVELTGDGAFRATVRGWSRHSTNVCRFLRPLLERLLLEVGYRSVAIERLGCVGNGNTQCSFSGTWVP